MPQPQAALTPQEAYAICEAAAAILSDSLEEGRRNPAPRFRDSARPLFRAYLKMCLMSEHETDTAILRAAFVTWGAD